MTYSLHKFEISPDSFDTGTNVRCADRRKLLYWETSKWSIRRTSKYDYLTMKHVSPGGGGLSLVESVFRFAHGATDVLTDDTLYDLHVTIQERARPFTPLRNDAFLATIDEMGEYIPL